MSPERLTFFIEQSELEEKRTPDFDRVEIFADVSLEDFLRAISGRGFGVYEHIFSENPGRNTNLGLGIGRTREIYSDGWVSDLGHHMRYRGKGCRFLSPKFEEASYFAHVKTPPLEGEDLITNPEIRNTQVLIVSNHHAREVRKMFEKAGIDTSLLRVAKGRLS